jgi:predicted permease
LIYFLHLRDRMLPVALLLALGYWLARRGWVPLKVASALCLYLFSPAQIISGMLHHGMTVAESARVMSAVAVQVGSLFLLGSLMGRVARVPPELRTAFTLTVMFMNTGFMGIPVCWLAFGPPGMAAAALIMVCHSMITNTVGVYLAARGRAESVGRALIDTIGSPIFASLVAAVALAASGVREGIDALAQAGVPAVLVLLGAQLALVEGEAPDRVVGLAVSLRLLVSPLMAILTARMFGLTGTMGRAFVVQSGMPVAVVVSLYALHFDCQPRFVSRTVVVSTFASLATVALVLSLV